MGKIQTINASATSVNTEKLHYGCSLEIITIASGVQQFPNHMMEHDFLLDSKPTGYSDIGIRHRGLPGLGVEE